MIGLVILATVVAIWTHPGGTEFKAAQISTEQLRAIGAMQRWRFVTWAVVCVAMIGALVAWAALR